jgi:hypothetical protein
VPERSASHPNASNRLPFIATYGDIYIAPPVLEFLRWLQDKYRGIVLPALARHLPLVQA